MKKNYLHLINNCKHILKYSRVILNFVVIIFFNVATFSQTAGPNFSGIGINLNTTGTIAWNNPNNIVNTLDTNYATAVFGGSANSNYLFGSNYNFSIPTSSVINGIEVTINRKTSATNGGRITKDNVVSLVKNGTITGSNKATTTSYTTSFLTATYGSSTDLWGTTWTAGDINNVNFGAALSVNSNNSLTASVDYISIKIYFTPAPIITNFSPGSTCYNSGSSITINGNYFNNASNVSINGVNCSYVINGNSQITATLPNGASTGLISITTPSGTTTSSSNLTINPIPSMSSITGSTNVCLNSTTTLSNATVGGVWSSSNSSIASINSSGIVTGNLAGNALLYYTITDSNGCSNSRSVFFTVNQLPTLTAPSTICLGNTAQLTPSSSGSWTSSDTNIATIDNTGLATSVSYGNVSFTFTENTNFCSNTTNSVSIPSSISFSSQPTSTQTICENSSVSLSVGVAGSGLTYQWYKDSNPISNGGSISGANSDTLIINPALPSDSSNNYYCVVTSCGNSITSNSASITVNATSVGGVASSSMPNVTPVVRSITECHYADGTIYLSGHTGNVIRWEYTTSGGTVWLPIADTSTTYNYNNITQSTFFRAVVQNGSSCSVAYSLVSLVNVIPNIKPTPVTATPQTICVGDSSSLYSESGFATNSYLASGGTFSNANPANWVVDGCGNCLNAGGSNTTNGPFRLSATNGGTYAGIDYASDGKFVIASGNYNSVMYTPTFNTFGLDSASLSFNHAFNLQAGASALVELSLDGGTTYTVVLASYSGPSTRSPYNNFPLESIDMDNYIGQPNLKIRFTYTGNANSSWAIDNILIPESPSNVAVQWVDSLTGEIISNTSTATVSPTVTTTYGITSFLNGCTSYGPEGTTYITVTVNQRPTANIGPSQTICNNGTASFTINLTGTSPWSITYNNGSTNTTINNITSNPYILNVPGITTNRTFTIVGLSDSKCTAKPQDLTGSAVVTVLNGTPGLWTGLVSTDWFDCKNWAGGLPSATIDAQILGGTTRMPVIDPSNSSFAAAYSNIASARDVIIANTANLTMVNSNSVLTVSRDWKNNGIFNTGQGTVSFNGSTSNLVQKINQGIKTNETFYNLTVNTTNGAKGVSLIDGFQLTVANLVSLLSGDLRLVGEAQLIQNGTAQNPTGGTGKLLVDQQGTKSSFHYNYWCSPVTTNGTSYSLANVLFDGTNSAANPFTQSPITYGNGAYFADGALSTPIKKSTSWLYKYTSVSTTYAGWQFIGSTGTVNKGEGFTMKGVTGSAAISSLQNYVFAGKPNSGTIPLTISLNQSYLVGNPYPSALDADEFIKDNIKDGAGRASSNIFNGALYFWDHFGGQTHILNQYVGGYACYTLMGGVVAVSNDPLTINNGSSGSKTPKRYIPVGQGFFIGTGSNSALTSNNPNLSTPVTGGTINFKNSQRVFVADNTSNSIFLRTNDENSANLTEVDNRQRIRLSFENATELKRQIMIGADENTTNLFDYGYDATIIDTTTDDMYWSLGEEKLVIQAVPNFGVEEIFPIGIKNSVAGEITIKIAELEYIPSSTELYIHDDETGIYTDIRNGDFSVYLPEGEFNNRFSLRFMSNSLSNNENISNSNTIAYFDNNSENLIIKNNNLNQIKKVFLFNLLGQKVSEFNIDNNENTLVLPCNNLSNSTYILKTIFDDSTVFSTKIINN
ncbi:beta strand repeat-containing protein [Flavobacterium capsici]|uniref:Ig-like domain-containing protein n=1 Tax=Flavobacterium capsici TaxID=3075618 RepID=A0AA96F2K2_9FLAO|nr:MULTISPECIES: Ig-like domain-containing protein [unclassified Flavobacterium]WNM20122.1 hypothetical protein RN608_05440 [Flavobacterium sp. PMR2A8]WNM21512.1 hypothetical protein RN605_12610 [Flavobacterium sp. PMTSA4]